MRILVVASQWFPDYAGGTARVVRATAEALAENGHDVVVIVPQMTGEPSHSYTERLEVRRVLRRTFLPMTVTDPLEMRRAIHDIDLNDIDVIMCHGEAAVVATFALSRRTDIGYVFHASPFREALHRRSLGVGTVERWRSLAVEPFLYIWERYALRRADQILVLSDFSRKLVLDFEPRAESRISIVGGGVDIDVFCPDSDRDSLRDRLGISHDQLILMTARRLVNRMGLDILLDAFHDLRAQHHNLRLVVIGDGEMRSSLEACGKRLGLGDSVDFRGRVSDSQLLDWYRASDLFILPTVAYEGFGMVTAEALACGTPVVGTPVGATGDLLRPLDDALLAAHANASSLASAIERTLTQATGSYRTLCRDYASTNFNWRTVISQWEEALGISAPTVHQHLVQS